MDVEKLEAKIRELETQVKNLQKLQDIEEIKKLQKAYGYYLINWMHEGPRACVGCSRCVSRC